MELSIIIPVWNEAGKISADLTELCKFIHQQGLSAEIIVVDDGSTDKTARRIEQFKENELTPLRLIRYQPHRGKGYAIRQGMQKAEGQIRLFMDSGQTIPLRYITEGLHLLIGKDCDLVLGTRHHRDSHIIKNFGWKRRTSSWLFRFILQYYLPLLQGLSDTQCGFKMFNGEAAKKIFASCKQDGFLLDIECILLANQFGFRICELPIEWRCDRDSRLALSTSLLPVLREIRNLKRNFFRVDEE